MKMTDLMFVTTTTSTAAGSEALPVGGATAASEAERFLSPSVPPAIPADQRYYWMYAWQQDIRDSMKALEEGDYVEFNSDDPNDVVRWLLEDDDEQ